MNLKLKKVNNQIYIVDVDAEIIEGDKYIHSGDMWAIHPKAFYGNIPKDSFKIIATPEQIDIDNLWEKYLEALAEKVTNEQDKVFYVDARFQKGYLQAKKETCFSLEDMRDTFEAGRSYQMGEYSEYHGGNEHNKPNKSEFIQQLKLSKIPECVVEIEIEEYSTIARNFKDINYRPKLTNNKVTITKILL